MAPPYSNWFPHAAAMPAARLRLFCLPFAGGNASLFRSWQLSLAPDIQVMAVQLPGRLERLRDRALTTFDEATAAVVAEMEPLLDRPFALFGASMGALLAYGVGDILVGRGQVPRHLFLASQESPRTQRRVAPVERMSDSEFLDLLRTFNGTPPGLLEHEELMDLMLPTLRSDFLVLETFVDSGRSPLPVPITAIRGREDWMCPLELVSDWEADTTVGFEVIEMDGDHFFVERAGALVTELVASRLAGALRPPEPA